MPCETHSSYEGGKNDKRRERNEAREEEKKKQCGVKKMKTEWNETLLMCTNTASSENTGTGEKEIRWGWEWKVTAVQIRAHYNNVHCVLELDFEMKFSTTNTQALERKKYDEGESEMLQLSTTTACHNNVHFLFARAGFWNEVQHNQYYRHLSTFSQKMHTQSCLFDHSI